MGSRIAGGTQRVVETSLRVCLSDRHAILDSAEPLRPGSTYLLCFGKLLSRIVVRAFVSYSHLLPDSPRRFEVALFFPFSSEGERLAALNRASVEPLHLHGHPKVVPAGELAAGGEPAIVGDFEGIRS